MVDSPLFLHATALSAVAVGSDVVLEGDEGRHAVTVRRVRVGDVVHIGDGQGAVVAAEVSAIDGRDRLVARVREVTVHARPQPSVIVVQAVIKGDRGEQAVEMLTELGVDLIVPWVAERSVARWLPGDRGVERWRRTAREAAKQSRRPFLPLVDEPVVLRDVVALAAASGAAWVLHESAETPLAPTAGTLSTGGPLLVVVGPEGGLSVPEVEALASAGARVVGLGPTVLRSATAGTVAAAVLMAACGRWVTGSAGTAQAAQAAQTAHGRDGVIDPGGGPR